MPRSKKSHVQPRILTEQDYIDRLEQIVWKGKFPSSPYVPNAKAWKLKDDWYMCSKTRKKFNVRTGTIFQYSNLPLWKWFYAFEMYSRKQGITAHQLMRSLDVDIKTAWFILHRLRDVSNIYFFNKFNEATEDLVKSEEVYELDEVYAGGTNANRHWDKKVLHSQGRSWKDKVPILVILELANSQEKGKLSEGEKKKLGEEKIITEQQNQKLEKDLSDLQTKYDMEVRTKEELLEFLNVYRESHFIPILLKPNTLSKLFLERFSGQHSGGHWKSILLVYPNFGGAEGDIKIEGFSTQHLGSCIFNGDLGLGMNYSKIKSITLSLDRVSHFSSYAFSNFFKTYRFNPFGNEFCFIDASSGNLSMVMDRGKKTIFVKRE